MPASSLTINPSRLDSQRLVAGDTPKDADRAAKAAAPAVVTPSLQAVMRSSRARAWIPPHLIASLRTKS